MEYRSRKNKKEYKNNTTEDLSPNIVWELKAELAQQDNIDTI